MAPSPTTSTSAWTSTNTTSRVSRRASGGGQPARRPDKKYPLTFVRIEPYVIPKKSLTGDNTERVDTRVMQVIYSLKPEGKPIYVGQQLDVFIDVSKKTDKPVAPPESSAK